VKGERLSSTSEHTWQKAGSKTEGKSVQKPPGQPPKCPECASRKIWKDGFRYTKNGGVQRYLCRSCGHRFSDAKVEIDVFKESFELPDAVHDLRHLDTVDLASGKVSFQNATLPISKDVGSHTFTDVGKRINSFLPYNRERQVCATERVAKNLSHQRIRKKRAAGATPDQATTKGLIIQYMAYLEKEGYYKDSCYVARIKRLARLGANLQDPESVKEVIARQQWKDSVKMLTTYAYDIMVKHILKIQWTPPKYKQKETLPWVPTETELDQLISASRSRRLTAFLQALKETYADPGEILRLEWKDITKNILTINAPVKGHNPGKMKISNKLLAMLNSLPKTSTRVFPTTYHSIYMSFYHVRKRAAQNLQNPRLLNVSFKSFRHWGGSMIAHYTNGNVLTVKKLLRHKSVLNSMKYIHTLNFKDDEFEVTTATDIEEAKKVLEAGFEYVTEKDGIMLFRKPKRFEG